MIFKKNIICFILLFYQSKIFCFNRENNLKIKNEFCKQLKDIYYYNFDTQNQEDQDNAAFDKLQSGHWTVLNAHAINYLLSIDQSLDTRNITYCAIHRAQSIINNQELNAFNINKFARELSLNIYELKEINIDQPQTISENKLHILTWYNGNVMPFFLLVDQEYNAESAFINAKTINQKNKILKENPNLLKTRLIDSFFRIIRQEFRQKCLNNAQPQAIYFACNLADNDINPNWALISILKLVNSSPIMLIHDSNFNNIEKQFAAYILTLYYRIFSKLT